VANKDYVRRGGGQRRKSAPQKSPKSNALPIRSGLVAVAVVCLFGYGLTLLGGESDPQPQSEPIAKTQPTSVENPQPKQEALPPPPTQEWDYEKMLPSKEIEVTAKDIEISNIPYVMQCGAYKTMEQAQERKANVAFQGISSEVRKKDDSSWYRVVLGPYTFKRDAERDKHTLQRAKIEPCAIWKETQ
jgi:cell division protein FtsN